MKVSTAPLFPLLILTLLAAATFWLERTTREAAVVGNGKERHDPDFVIDNFTTQRFNIDGSLQHTLSARQMIHYADDDSTEVVAPNITYFARTPPTRLDARRAWIGRDGKEIRLLDEVRLMRAAGGGQPALLVTSEELRVFPDDELARTATPVTIVHGNSTLHGTGLEASNRTRQFTLNGPAQGTLTRKPSETP